MLEVLAANLNTGTSYSEWAFYVISCPSFKEIQRECTSEQAMTTSTLFAVLIMHSWVVYNQMFELLLIKPNTSKGGRVVLNLIGSWVDKKFATFYGSSILAGFIS
jgi:hypothetical protein